MTDNLKVDFDLPEYDIAENFWNGIDFSESFSIDSSDNQGTRYIKPPRPPFIKEDHLYFENAEKLARDINLQGNDNIFVILSGNFIYGDFIEALFYEKEIFTERLQISTLSLNYANIISLRNLMRGGYVKNLDLIVSAYFYAHERSLLIKDIYNNLDIDNRFQLAVAGVHTKIASFRTELGKSYVLYGSANLRGSNSVEQLKIEDNAELYGFVTDFNNRIIESSLTIRKNLRGNKLWQQLQEAEVKEAEKQAVPHKGQI